MGCLLVSYRKTYVHLDAGKDVFDIQVTDSDKASILEVRRSTRCTDDLEHLAEEGLRHIATKRFDARLLAKPAIRTVLHWSVAVSKWGCTARALVARALVAKAPRTCKPLSKDFTSKRKTGNRVPYPGLHCLFFLFLRMCVFWQDYPFCVARALG